MCRVPGGRGRTMEADRGAARRGLGVVRRDHPGAGGCHEGIRRHLGLFVPRRPALQLGSCDLRSQSAHLRWIDLIVAVILIVCGFAVVSGSGPARWIGIFAAAIAGISAIWWMPFYPVWALVYIIIAFLVIYALAVYGGVREPS